MHPLFELGLELPPKGARTLLRDMHRQMRTAISSGRLKPGVQLPSTRSFAETLGVSRNTALALYDLLLSEGFLFTRQGAGTFVSDTLPPAIPRRRADADRTDPRLPRQAANLVLDLEDAVPHLSETEDGSHTDSIAIDMRLGMPDKSLFPFDIWRRLSNRCLRALAGTPAGYSDPAGPVAFRHAISAHVSFARAVASSEQDVIATNGAQQAFDLIARTLVVPGKTVVSVEDPGYPPLRAAFSAAGARLVAIPVDNAGLIVEKLPEDTRIICVTPSHQFPSGAVMTLERRSALLSFARRRDAVIVEDDYDSEFRFGGRPLDALQTLDRDGSVFYVGTFSKCLFPALRLGFIVAPPWASDAIARVRWRTDWHGPLLPQLTLAAFIEDGHLARHVRRMRRVYSARRKKLLDALALYCPEQLQVIESEAGLHLAALLAPGQESDRVVKRLRSEGLALETLGKYALAEPTPNGIAFGYGTCTEDQIAPAVARLAAVLSQP